jgi:hypothetical protein
MNSLKPEKRTDVNGKTTTRWVRDTGSTPKSSLANVPPVIAAQGPVLPTRENAPLMSSFVDKCRSNNCNGVSVTIEDIHPETARILDDILAEADDSDSSYWFRRYLDDAFSAGFSSTKMGTKPKTFTDLNNFAVFYVAGDEPTDRIVKGLRTYRRFHGTEDFRLELDAQELMRAQALGKVINGVPLEYRDVNTRFPEDDEYGESSDSSHHYARLENNDLAEFVMANPELADDIISIVKERKSDDLGMIRNVLENPAQVLREGAL